MTPVAIELLLKCYYSPAPLEGLEYPAQREVVENFIADGLIVPGKESNCYTVTDRGNAHVYQLCNLPYPVAVWMGGDGKPIYP